MCHADLMEDVLSSLKTVHNRAVRLCNGIEDEAEGQDFFGQLFHSVDTDDSGVIEQVPASNLCDL